VYALFSFADAYMHASLFCLSFLSFTSLFSPLSSLSRLFHLSSPSLSLLSLLRLSLGESERLLQRKKTHERYGQSRPKHTSVKKSLSLYIRSLPLSLSLSLSLVSLCALSQRKNYSADVPQNERKRERETIESLPGSSFFGGTHYNIKGKGCSK
jgi:hypothetical protein